MKNTAATEPGRGEEAGRAAGASPHALAIAAGIAPVGLGVVAFLLVVGPRALYPTNIAWLGQGDPATHYLGWAFFRDSPWSFPIGLNPRYGLEIASAIVFSDSIPLLAFVFKPFSALLPGTFQYFGLWLLLCFVLQACFAWRLVGLVSADRTVRVLGSAFFVLAPPMLWRLQGHFSLVGHFLVLAALYLAVRPPAHGQPWRWACLLATAALVHPYFLAMTGALWIADLAARTFAAPARAATRAGELAVLVLLTAIVCWQAGYFSVGGSAVSGGYGMYRFNLVSLVNPLTWSFVLEGILQGPGDYEGFNYLGLGVIVLILACLPAWIGSRGRLLPRLFARPFLLAVLAGLALFAVTHRIGLGQRTVELPLWAEVEQWANVFRSSGRMFWPVYYTILLAVIAAVAHAHPRRVSVPLLAFALSLQVVDTSAGWHPIRKSLMADARAQWQTPLQSSFWREAANRYTKVRMIPPRNEAPGWQIFAAYARTHGLATDAVYLARLDAAGLAAITRRAERTMASGTYDPDTLYVFSDSAAVLALPQVDASRDVLARIDGFVVLAPGWKACGTCRSAPTPLTLHDVLKPVAPGERVEFNESARTSAYLVRGWSHPEPWGTWSEGPEAELLLPVSGEARNVTIEAHPLVSASHPKQRIVIEVNGVPAWEGDVRADSGAIDVPIDETARAAAERDGLLRLRFRLPDAARPKDLGINQDVRVLALGLRALTVR
ncbi:MAG TPA: DUF6311 domain-containing protein [Burkholderiales bacterium]